MNRKFKNSFAFHLAIVILLAFLLYIGFFVTLHWLSRHGERVVIPDVKGKNMYVAVAELQAQHYEIAIDSTYEPALKPLAVLKQVPDSGAIVKEGRTVFLTVNMLTPPHIPMPNLVNLSYRSAEMLLRNNKLIMGDTTHVPDIAAGAVKQQQYKGRDIKAGEMISQGSKVNLVIGDGLGNTQFDVPEITGMTVDEAMTVLDQYGLQPIISAYDAMNEIIDTPSAKIIQQIPAARNASGSVNRIKEGDYIDLRIR